MAAVEGEIIPRVGRPSDYRPEYADQAYRFCLLGATNQQLADFFQVSTKTIWSWMKKKEAFLRAITEGRAKADAEVAFATYHNATVNMNFQAQRFWLMNRQPEKWRDKQELEVSQKGLPELLAQVEERVRLEKPDDEPVPDKP